MNISDMPIIEYLRLCLKTAEHRGFLWVMVLLARERDIPNGYADIKRYWNSYDDLTGDKILFLLTTSNNPDEHTENILIHEKERYNRIGSSNLLIVNNKPLHISEEDFPANAEDYWIREEALRNTSLHISPILRKYRLSERDIPAILLIPTMEHSSPVIIRGINDVYSSLRSLIIYLEPLLREFDDCKLIMANKDNEIADTVNAIQANNQMITDKRIQKYLQSKEYVGNFMKGMDSDSRESLKSAIDNRDLSVCARFEQPLRAHLNRLIDMQPQIGEIEFDSQTYAARNAELSEKKKRLECEHEELGNNLFALRKKIYETAGEYCKGLLNMNTKNTNLCGKSQLIDVLIMVATVEEENAILQDVGWEYQYTAKGYGYYHRKEGLSFAVARAAEMGEIPAAVAAQHYVEQLKPRFLSMAGFCAGREGSVNLGDVFVPIKIYDYDNGGKQLTEDTVLPEMNLTQLDPIWRQKIERFGSEWRDTISITKPVPYEPQFIGLLKILIENNYSIRLDSLKKSFPQYPDLDQIITKEKNSGKLVLIGKKIKATPIAEKQYYEDYYLKYSNYKEPELKIRMGALATGNKVQQWGKIFDKLTKQFDRKTYAIDMEGYAVSQVAVFQHIPCVIAKGVGDFASENKSFDNRYVSYAVYSAYRFLVSFFNDLKNQELLGQ